MAVIRYLRKTAEIIGYLFFVTGILISILLYLYSDDNKARQAGYADEQDRRAAVAAGVADPEAWKAKRKAEKEKADAEAAALAATADRERAEREARAAKEREAQEAGERARAAKAEADCKSDLRCWAEKGVIAAGVYCRSKIERLAKYDMKWTDAWYEQKFSRFRWSRTAPKGLGVVTFVGDKAQFQNGFGAFQNVIYTCDMVPGDESHTIYDVSIDSGRLD